MLKIICAIFATVMFTLGTAYAETKAFDASIDVSDAIFDEMIARQQVRNAGSGWFIVTVESNSIASGGAISIYEKISDRAGYIHLPPDGLAAKGILNADAAASYSIDPGSDATVFALDLLTNGWAGEKGGLYEELFEAMNRMGAEKKELEASLTAMRIFRNNARFVEKVEMGGRESFFLYADGLNHTQVSEGVTYTIKEMGLWIDVNDYVITGMKFVGDSKQGKKKDTFEIQQVMSDYQTARGASVLIPHKKSMSFRLGHIDNKETERMKRALKEAERELAGIRAKVSNGEIPAAQGNMIANQIAKAIEQQKKFLGGVANEGIGAETKVLRTWSTPTKEGLKQVLKEASEFSAKQAGSNAAFGVLDNVKQ